MTPSILGATLAALLFVVLAVALLFPEKLS